LKPCAIGKIPFRFNRPSEETSCQGKVEAGKSREKQNNRPPVTKRYRQIVEEHPDSPYAKSSEDSFGGVGEGALEIYPGTVFLRGGFSA
jgi:hypothetical protein